VKIANFQSLDFHLPYLHTIETGKTEDFYYKVKAEDKEDGNQDSGNLQFSLDFENNEDFLEIENNGVIKGGIDESLKGNYNIEVCVKDRGIKTIHENISLCNNTGKSNKVCEDLRLTITEKNKKPEITDYYPKEKEITEFQEKIEFKITKKDADWTVPDTFWYVDDVLKEKDIGSLRDEFTYEDYCIKGENHTIRAEITDGLLREFIEWKVSFDECSYETLASPKQEKSYFAYLIFVIVILTGIILIKLRSVLRLNKNLKKSKWEY
jgi:hypothetical protein